MSSADVRCRRCRRQLGTTISPRFPPTQCLDPTCADMPATSENEERDSAIEHLRNVELWSPALIGEHFGLTRQRVNAVLSAR